MADPRGDQEPPRVRRRGGRLPRRRPRTTPDLSGTPTRWGVLLPSFDPLRTGATPPVAEAARRAEALGFDGVWAGDHLACPAPVLDAPAVLATATGGDQPGQRRVQHPAARPARAGLGGQAAGHPAGPLRGRLRLGVGVGGELPGEFAAAGVPRASAGPGWTPPCGSYPSCWPVARCATTTRRCRSTHPRWSQRSRCRRSTSAAAASPPAARRPVGGALDADVAHGR